MSVTVNVEKIPDYVEAGFDPRRQRPAPRLRLRLFNMVLEAFPRVCEDVVVCDEQSKALLLTDRREHPEGPYVSGGGMKRNELERETAVRRLEAEFGLIIDSDSERLKLVWRLRRYLCGTFDAFVNLYAVMASEEEISAMRITDKKEFIARNGIRPYTLEQLEGLEDQGFKQAPLLIEIHGKIFTS